MGTCYVVFKGEKPGIYMAWHECSEQVLGFKNAIYKKYNNYGIALSEFNSYFGAPTPSTKVFPIDGWETIPLHLGNHGSWKNVIIMSLIMLVFGLWIKLSMFNNCKL
jgi:hypothetical protein